MTLSLIIFILILYFLLVNSKVKNPRKKFIVITTFVMILISGLRHEGVGNDTYATMLKFEEAATTNWKDVLSDFWVRYFNPNISIGKDPAEMLFYKLLSYITSDSRVFLFVVATIILVSLGYYTYKCTQSLRSTLFSYILFISISYGYMPNSSFRQSIAFAILLPAYLYLKDKKYLLFILLLLLASFFHKSVFITSIILPFMFVKQKDVKMIYWLFLIPFVFVFFNYRYVGFLLGDFNDVYGSYLGLNYYNYHSQPFMVILMILGLYLYNGVGLKKDADSEKNVIYILGGAQTLVFVSMIRLDPSALRLISYFAVLMAIQVGNSSGGSVFMRNVFSVIISIFLIKAALNPDDGYRFMWQEKKLHDRYGMIDKPLQISPNNEQKTFIISSIQNKVITV